MYLNIQKYLEIFEIESTKKILKLDNFFKSFFKKTILLFGRSEYKKESIISYLIHCYSRFIGKKLVKKNLNIFRKTNENSKNFSNFFIEINLKRKNQINSKKLINLNNKLLSNFKSKIKIEKKIIILYNIETLNKIDQIRLKNIINKFKKFFFFIITSQELNNINSFLITKSICFPISAWTFLSKQYFDKMQSKHIIFSKLVNSHNTCFRKQKIYSFIHQIIKMQDFSIFKYFFFIFYTYSNLFFSYLYNLYEKNRFIKINKNNKIDLLVKNCIQDKILKIIIEVYFKNFVIFSHNYNFEWNKTKNLISVIVFLLSKNLY